MNSNFKTRLLSFFIQLLALTLILFAVHSYLLHYFFSGELFFPLWHIYSFHFLVTLFFYVLISYRYFSGNSQIFNAFMIATFLKMALSIIFLLPLIFSELPSKKADVLNFFIPYFIFLAFEVYSINYFLLNETPKNQ